MNLRASQYKDKEKLRKTRNAQRKRYYKKTQTGKRKKWTELEEIIILESKLRDSELAKILKRSVQSIQIKRTRLRIFKHYGKLYK